MISRFRGEYRWLSNFWPVQLSGESLTYPSAEHAFQAAKCADPADRALFTSGTAGEAKALGRRVKMRPDWNAVKLGVMRVVLRKKFAPGTELAARLLATGDEELVEGNTWGDRFWGQCPVGRGENWLGRLLMEQRARLQAQEGTRREKDHADQQ